MIVIYEVGLLMLDAKLRVRWHQRKYINDVFVGIEQGLIKFVRDHELAWAVRIEDGELQASEPT